LRWTLRLDLRGGVRADTTLVVDGHPVRVALDRLETLPVRRPF
jgi:hypothetical protein